jgi:hypothetical protein
LLDERGSLRQLRWLGFDLQIGDAPRVLVALGGVAASTSTPASAPLPLPSTALTAASL